MEEPNLEEFPWPPPPVPVDAMEEGVALLAPRRIRDGRLGPRLRPGTGLIRRPRRWQAMPFFAFRAQRGTLPRLSCHIGEPVAETTTLYQDLLNEAGSEGDPEDRFWSREPSEGEEEDGEEEVEDEELRRHLEGERNLRQPGAAGGYPAYPPASSIPAPLASFPLVRDPAGLFAPPGGGGPMFRTRNRVGGPRGYSVALEKTEENIGSSPKLSSGLAGRLPSRSSFRPWAWGIPASCRRHTTPSGRATPGWAKCNPCGSLWPSGVRSDDVRSWHCLD